MITPFKIQVDEEKLSELRRRLQNARWPYQIPDSDWRSGTDVEYLKELVQYWLDGFDWREQEASLNRFAQFTTDVEGTTIHFVHERGNGPKPFPLILTHGWPDSFYRFYKLIPRLTDPAAFGGRADDAFDVVVPSLPGYAFSEKPGEHGSIFRVNDLWATLMKDKLGYQRFGAHGGDWGGTVTEHLGRGHSDCVAAMHLTDVPFFHIFNKVKDPSVAEAKYFEHNRDWMQTEGAYASLQSTRPMSLAPAMNDSPAGLAAWIIEKFRLWSDCGGDIESRFTKDELLTNIMLYWVTDSASTSFLPYYDFANASAFTWIKESIKSWGACKVPAAFAMFPKDISHPPREWAERFFNVQRWTEMPRGGHFAAMEEPELVAADLRDWFRQFR